MKYSIVIPNYNGSENIANNVPRVISILGDKSDYEIVIVDDCSIDDSIEVIELLIQKNKDVDLKLVKTDKNKGFSSAVNLGVQKSKGDIIILLNSDAFPKSNFLSDLSRHFENEDIFAVGFMDESHEEGDVVLRGRGVGQWRRGFLIHKAGGIDKTNSLWASGGSSAFKKTAWDRLEGLNEIYNPFYWEDIDISYRALKAGYQIYFDRDIRIIHEHEKGIIRKKFSPSYVRQIAYRNQFLFTWINADLKNVALNVLWLPYNVIRSFIALDTDFIKGFFRFILLLPKALGSRSLVNKLFVKSDSEVIIKE